MSIYNLIASENFKFILIILMIWDGVWKGIAMWKAARNSSKPWFIVLMVVNSLGILPIVYLLLNKIKQQKQAL